jgi:Fur family ferric uptake transcriptional regulator
VLGQQPRPASAYVHGLEDAVPAQHAEVVGAQDRGVGRDDAPAQHGHYPVSHAAERNRRRLYDRSVSDVSLAEVLRARGLRLTAQRQLVLQAVRDLAHATPEQVHAAVREVAAGVNITTVYRTLELLEELGLVTHTHLSHGSPTYHAPTDDQHVHLVCRSCGAVDEVDPRLLDPLAGTLEEQRGFLVDIGHVALFGVCAKCGERQ